MHSTTVSHIKQDLASIRLAQLDVLDPGHDTAFHWFCKHAGAAAMNTAAAQRAFLQLLTWMDAQQAVLACDIWASNTCSAWDLPGLQQLDVTALFDIIVIAVQRHEVNVLPKLVLLPAAAQLSPTSVCVALTHLAAKPLWCTQACEALLSLPAAQHMPEVYCRTLLDSALQHAPVAYLHLLLERVPVALQLLQRELPLVVLQEVIVAAADQGNEAMVLRCLGHAQAALLPPAAVYRIVEAAAPAVWTPTVVSRLLCHPERSCCSCMSLSAC